nr:hypothetical protein Iba_chr04cCG3580 [Ipomoea batatas]
MNGDQAKSYGSGSHESQEQRGGCDRRPRIRRPTAAAAADCLGIKNGFLVKMGAMCFGYDTRYPRVWLKSCP